VGKELEFRPLEYGINELNDSRKEDVTGLLAGHISHSRKFTIYLKELIELQARTLSQNQEKKE
jgi:hypothetical protein